MNANVRQPDYLFLDCEWADVTAKELVSIGLASIDGKRFFYAEVDELPPDPTPWVQSVVYPLLERGEFAMSVTTMSIRLHAFLATFERPLICYDFAMDRDLCESILQVEARAHASALKEGLKWELLRDVTPSLKRWWEEHAEAGARRHHALVDAFALRAAYLSLWGI